MMRADDPREMLLRDIKLLRERVWENRIDEPAIEDWLSNFTGSLYDADEEKLHALHLLRHFVYFGSRETRVLLEALYRDIYQYPILQCIREREGGTLDVDLVDRRFNEELDRTRFVPMGNPSESGAHLLYYFRQVNGLRKDLFASHHELASGPLTDPESRLMPTDLNRVVFIDDLLGSGSQAVRYSRTIVRDLRTIAARQGTDIRLCYYTLFAKPEGLARARATDFDEVHAVHELDDSQMAFAPNSRVYHGVEDYTSVEKGRALAQHYGERLVPQFPLGFGEGQMLMGFPHNVPDNTLPIVWFDEPTPYWNPIFPRFNKVYY